MGRTIAQWGWKEGQSTEGRPYDAAAASHHEERVVLPVLTASPALPVSLVIILDPSTPPFRANKTGQREQHAAVWISPELRSNAKGFGAEEVGVRPDIADHYQKEQPAYHWRGLASKAELVNVG